MSQFEIFISPKGPVLLEGEQRIKAVDAVLKGRSQFGDIVSYTGMAKSSASVALSKLADDGIIRTEGEGNEKRFLPLAIRIVTSVEPDLKGVINVLRRWDSSKGEKVILDNIEHIMAAYLMIEAHQHGVSIAPILVETAKLLAQAAYDRTSGNGPDRAIDNLLDFFSRTAYAEVSCVSSFPPTFDIRIPYIRTETTRQSVLDIVYMLMTEYLSLMNGNTIHVSEINELRDDAGTVRITLGFNDMVPEYSNGRYHDFKFYETGFRDFAVYKVEGSYIPVSDGLELGIIECLSKHPSSSRDLSKELDVPQTTILGHMKKMEGSKLVMSYRAGNRSIFVLSAEKVFAWSRPVSDSGPGGRRYLELMWEHPEHISQLFLSFIIVDSYTLGFDISSLMGYLGRRVAEMILGLSPATTAEQIFSMIQKESKRLTASEIVLKSYNPPTVVRVTDYDMEPAIAECQKVFYNSVFATIFGRLMHIQFTVKNDKISGEGLRRYEASFIPKFG